MELPVREQWMRNLIAEWAGTARELRALARWCDDQAAQMELLNDEPLSRPSPQVIEVHRHDPTGTTYQLEYKRCGKPKSRYIGKKLQPEHFFDRPTTPTPARPTATPQTR